MTALSLTVEQTFGVEYVPDSIKVYETTVVKYEHSELSAFLDNDSVARTYSHHHRDSDWND